MRGGRAFSELMVIAVLLQATPSPFRLFSGTQSARLAYRQFPGIAIFEKEHRRLLLIQGRNHESRIQTDDF